MVKFIPNAYTCLSSIFIFSHNKKKEENVQATKEMKEKKRERNPPSNVLNKFSTLDVSSFKQEKENLNEGDLQKVLLFLLKELSEKDLEILGEAFTQEDFNLIFKSKNFFSSSLFLKSNSLLIRLPLTTFNDLLNNNESFFLLLKKGAEGEPVQHLISRFSKEQSHELDSYFVKLKDLESSIQNLDLKSLTCEQLQNIKRNLNEARFPAKKNLTLIEKTLQIAWLSLRSDLVNELSFFKESFVKFLNLALGVPKSENENSTGLFLQLDLRLSSVFTKVEDSSIEPLSDEEPIQEGLAKLSIWHFNDFKEIGLIEEGKDYISEEEFTEDTLRSSLFAKIRNKLEKLGLNTIKDLRHREIYSKPMLKEYISSLKKE